MTVADWQLRRDRFQEAMASRGSPTTALTNASGSILLGVSTFEPFEGEYENSSRLMLAMCVDGGGQFRRKWIDGEVSDVLKPGSLAIALPQTPAIGHWPKARMLGISIEERALEPYGIAIDSMGGAAAQLHHNAFMSAVMGAMWRDAEFHGLSSAFFEQGISALLHQIGTRRVAPTRSARVSPKQLSMAMNAIEARIDEDFSVERLAVEMGHDVRTMTRAFRHATGFAPFAYLTHRRMERARQLLTTGLDIIEVAHAVGYTNPSKFSAAFRRVTGLLPSDWRAKIKN